MNELKNFRLAIQEKNFIYENIENNFNLILSISKEIEKKLNRGGKIYICGNGGSAADAQHLAAEFLVRLKPQNNRKPYPVVSLALDTSTLTACSNDYGFDYIFSRPLSALASSKDLLIILSTSGNSKNLIEVLKTAKKKKIFSIGLLGQNGGKCKKLCDVSYVVPGNNIARIQEVHIFLGHFIFEIVEKKLKKNFKKLLK